MGLIYSNIPELEGSNTEIALENLSELEATLEIIFEKRMAHLSELAQAMLGDGEDADIIKSIMLSIKSEGKADSGNLIGENRHAGDAIFEKVSLIERLAVFKEVFGKLCSDKKSFIRLFPEAAVVPSAPDASERIAYLKNSYNDVAYMQFSSLLTSPRAAYFGSVSDVCESVYKGECEYCILPIESSADGKLLSFYEIILKYNFKVNAVYDYQNDAQSYTRYALLSKKFIMDMFNLRSKTRNRYFEFLVSVDDSLPLEDLLSAAGYCSLKLRRIDTLDLYEEKNGKKAFVCPVFKTMGADLQTFIAFLAVDCPDFIPLGLYMQI